MNNIDVYLYIPRERILNFQSKKHQSENKDRFRTVYFYKKKYCYKMNEKDITEVDLYDVKDLQIDTFYKSSYKSSKDDNFDWYCKLKPKFNNCKEIYLEKKSEPKNRLKYIENIKRLKYKQHQPINYKPSLTVSWD